MIQRTTLPLAVLAIALIAGPAFAQNRALSSTAQQDLDEATQKRVSAKSLGDLAQIIELTESALKKGLDEGNQKFAIGLLTSTLYDRATRLCQPIFDRSPPDPRWQQLRGLAIADLEKALRRDREMGDAYFLYARLQALPGGKREIALAAAAKAVEYYKDDDKKLSEAVTLRGSLSGNIDEQLAAFDKAIKLDPKNQKALRARGLVHLSKQEKENAMADFRAALVLDASDLLCRHGVAQILAADKKYDEALAELDLVLKSNPESIGTLKLKAQVHVAARDQDAAIFALNDAVKAAPRDIASLMLRAQLRRGNGDNELAMADVNRVLQIQPGLVQAILLRARFHAADGDLDDAISNVKALVKAAPENKNFRFQLALLYISDQRPRQAIVLFDQILADDPNLSNVRRARGDALLSIGQQKEAIAEFRTVLRKNPDDNNALNNLAWVMSTSPDKNLRDARLAMKLATRACENTNHEQPHMLSTLAAANAEQGDFDTAVKWSTKAVELAQDNIKKQLTNELASYKNKKPWRELKEIKENPGSERPRDDDLNLN